MNLHARTTASVLCLFLAGLCSCAPEEDPRPARASAVIEHVLHEQGLVRNREVADTMLAFGTRYQTHPACSGTPPAPARCAAVRDSAAAAMAAWLAAWEARHPEL